MCLGKEMGGKLKMETMTKRDAVGMGLMESGKPKIVCDVCGDQITTETYLHVFGRHVCPHCVHINTEYLVADYVD